MVMGDSSCSRGHVFESCHQILDEHFLALICCKNYIVCLKRPKINDFFKKRCDTHFNPPPAILNLTLPKLLTHVSLGEGVTENQNKD